MPRTLLAAVVLVFALSAGQASHAQPQSPELWSSQKVLAVIAKPMVALYEALAADAALPRPTSDRERLERLGKIDQSWRYYMGELDFEGLSPEETKAVYDAIAARTEPIDRANLAAVMAMRPREGWFTVSRYGPEASEAAFHIVQHGDSATRQRLLPDLASAAAQGDIDGEDFATMYDRVQTGLGKPQRYGTQFRCVDHRPVPYPLEDEARIEAFRAPLNFKETFAERARVLAEKARC